MLVMGWLAPCFLMYFLSLSVPELLFPPMRLRGKVVEGADVSMRMCVSSWLAMSSVWQASNDNALIAQWAALWPHSLNLNNFHDVHLAQRRYT